MSAEPVVTEKALTVGEALVELLALNGVEVVFGIPGVHTVELYRGLAASPIRHVTPRHEQGAGFMADGYARVTGRPGVALVITGPGLTNTLTAMAQARQDSIPILVISGVNRRDSLGHGRGLLHELPDQHALAKTVALYSHTLLNPADLPAVIERAFAVLGSGRPGPVHIEIPTDVMAAKVSLPATVRPAQATRPRADAETLQKAAILSAEARRPVILCGGGAITAEAEIRDLAERIGAPVVTTVNARGMMAGHPLNVPASPSLKAVRALIRDADLVLAFGTEMGQTDYDMYADGGFPLLDKLIRIDIDATQLAAGPQTAMSILSGARAAALGMLGFLPDDVAGDGARRAEAARKATLKELTAKMRAEIDIIDTIYKTLPEVTIVGDSTQVVYAGNLFCNAPRPRSWFNSATGFGALGYAPPAAIGATVGVGGAPVICLVGDGGIQFSLAEIGSAADISAPVIFLVWNNDGYQEIETYMIDNGIVPEGVRPGAPDFPKAAEAYGIPGKRLARLEDLAAALTEAAARKGPSLIEIHETLTAGIKR
ncbi:acetolactate synthase-1/2/3 large subunit [Rhizobium sp. RU20A]|uniref:5-guanidino-2-oxopentanoate decarboxylase n=1 Tax=Rhizobium sp. RU20A TaxID=1907412 RepID=UPI0009553242|nr:5-guanidino-2-oxopentanoate decarboxylase [Rhizobium sp. RU20A]SIQ97799.1 acetolactate synthase-1/2/3 large subunit [Rhizobium sp. RU20A]